LVDSDPSFDTYVRARTAALSRVAYLLTGDHHLAKDLVQQTLLRVVGRWARICAAGDPDPYVRRALYHEHISAWRRAGRRPRPAGAPAGSPEAWSDLAVSADPSDAVVANVAMRHALAQLGPRQRAVLVLRYFEDLSEAQTAELLGIRVGTVKSRARDGLARLRTLLPSREAAHD
jgi:RNA polymerase sigma-70 factor (sigma-E family)